MKCKNCGEEKRIANKWHKLCHKCNLKRLEALKQSKVYEHTKTRIKSLRLDINSQKLQYNISSHKAKKKTMLELDEEFYKTCFEKSDHKCEECKTDLPTEFKNESGELIARWRYSHILPKSIFPQFRHNTDNINHLCLRCHQQWDFGNKKSMFIYVKNKQLWSNFL